MSTTANDAGDTKEDIMTVTIEQRPEVHDGPPKLGPEELRAAQRRTLDSPRMKYGLLAKMMFLPVDLMYGKRGSYTKFAMLEIIARVPYQAWERMGYWALHRHRGTSTLAKRVVGRIVEARSDQDNEQFHLLIMQDLVQRGGHRQNWLLHRAAPWAISFFYYHVSWLLFLVKPELSYRLNAEFEDHAEHEYMNFVAENPELEFQPAPGTYAAEYGHYASVADLLRQIGHDERVHKLDSLANLPAPRFHQSRA
ncbi:alternative oxidase [Spongiactinospora sp. TRM90649]|uniref:alternative oxidase n=1 Tax=Spongiactinospora sp. TRM90649 TaxID=3031114 RepID=UPI0023F63B64|nr:alternative oxidase [Spongiactinospora sp. TRM90649]MDF5753937.1 alternative oxidase [Spongiactinospora sp. TRM90649]